MNTLTLTSLPGARHSAVATPSMTLPIGEARTLRRGAGARIEVTGGRVWLTVPNDPDDHFVAGGESMLLRHDGPIVIQSDGGSSAVLRIVAASTNA
ncbi:DUF2917 domain-containing protein [Variovorax paradoxus]|nr:DUF2917 domain-containing protein [Variovorax paradoxus]